MTAARKLRFLWQPNDILISDLEKSDFEFSGTVIKLDPMRHLVFGFFSITEVEGRLLEDTQGDRISAETLEQSAYDFVLHARTGGEMHDTDEVTGEVRGVGKLVESVVFTDEKQKAMLKALQDQGINAELNLHCVCWFGGFWISDEETWAKVVNGTLKAFSIGGRGKREKCD